MGKDDGPRPQRLQRTDRALQRVEIAERALGHAVGGAGIAGQALQTREVERQPARRHAVELGLDRGIAGRHEDAEPRGHRVPPAMSASAGITRPMPAAKGAMAARTRSLMRVTVGAGSSRSIRPIRTAPDSTCDQYASNETNSMDFVSTATRTSPSPASRSTRA